MPVATALKTRLESAIASRQNTLARARAKAKDIALKQQHTLGAVLTGFAFGAAEKNAMALPTFGGIDPKLLYGGAALIAAYMLRGQPAMRRILSCVADGALPVVAYNQGKGISPISLESEGAAPAGAAGYF